MCVCESVCVWCVCVCGVCGVVCESVCVLLYMCTHAVHQNYDFKHANILPYTTFMQLLLRTDRPLCTTNSCILHYIE